MGNKKLVIGWLFWLVAAIFYALDYFQHTAPSVLIKPISLDMDVGVDQIAYVMSIYFPIYAISQVPAGMLLDRFGARVMLSISCLVMSLGILLFVYEPNLETMLLGRILIAIGSAVAFIGCLKVAADVLPERFFPIAVGLTNTLGVLGGIFGQLFLNYLVSLSGWKDALAYIGYFGIVWGVVIILLLTYKKEEKDISNLVESKTSRFFHSLILLKNKKLWLLAIYSGLMVGIVVNSFSELYDVVFLEQAYHVTESVAARISVMMFVGIAFGGPSHGIIASLFGEKRIWMFICNIFTITIFSSIVLFASIINPNLLFILFFLLGFFVSSMLLAFSVVEEIFPKEIKGTALAIVNMVIGLCGALFQFLISYISVLLNGGPIHINVNNNVFDRAFVFLLVPLLISTVIISYMALLKYRDNRRKARLLQL
ncbi:MFS transporter [Francisella frigiditurris]|uniref:Lysosomal dipeptide transporter MFSD1 n=1 Tax=Francisella frigiditurris TaxID=1542390 RepID=A0A1J0KUF7_9GAMM|nr:MFS transporter [Francisella frigiditurris]APC97268.1 sugar (and other) transporter family protein [Francisella frigiditurris]